MRPVTSVGFRPVSRQEGVDDEETSENDTESLA